MNFEKSIEDGFVKIVSVDTVIAKSLFKSSKEAILAAKFIELKDYTEKTILRELYEGLRQYIEAIGYIKGYKFLSHESMTYFIRDILLDKKSAEIFDRYRKLRNNINYYGKDISTETVKKSLIEVPYVIKRLELNVGQCICKGANCSCEWSYNVFKDRQEEANKSKPILEEVNKPALEVNPNAEL